MIRILLLSILSIAHVACAQTYTSSSIFAHNDYAQKNPFHNAYTLQVGYIEADVFLQDGQLLVAHEMSEVKSDRTLESLYFEPIRKKIKINNGRIYADPLKKLTLMIDLKSEGMTTLNAIVKKLSSYPEILSCETLTISISGNVPDRAQWNTFPRYIYFDGRPGIEYTPTELERISFISTSFRAYSTWNGSGPLPEDDRQKILTLRNEVHSKNKKLRFWGAPDILAAWKVWMELGIDILGTDKVSEMTELVKRR
jgi:alkaline phosphatase